MSRFTRLGQVVCTRMNEETDFRSLSIPHAFRLVSPREMTKDFQDRPGENSDRKSTYGWMLWNHINPMLDIKNGDRDSQKMDEDVFVARMFVS